MLNTILGILKSGDVGSGSPMSSEVPTRPPVSTPRLRPPSSGSVDSFLQGWDPNIVGAALPAVGSALFSGRGGRQIGDALGSTGWLALAATGDTLMNRRFGRLFDPNFGENVPTPAASTGRAPAPAVRPAPRPPTASPAVVPGANPVAGTRYPSAAPSRPAVVPTGSASVMTPDVAQQRLSSRASYGPPTIPPQIPRTDLINNLVQFLPDNTRRLYDAINARVTQESRTSLPDMMIDELGRMPTVAELQARVNFIADANREAVARRYGFVDSGTGQAQRNQVTDEQVLNHIALTNPEAWRNSNPNGFLLGSMGMNNVGDEMIRRTMLNRLASRGGALGFVARRPFAVPVVTESIDKIIPDSWRRTGTTVGNTLQLLGMDPVRAATPVSTRRDFENIAHGDMSGVAWGALDNQPGRIGAFGLNVLSNPINSIRAIFASDPEATYEIGQLQNQWNRARELNRASPVSSPGFSDAALQSLLTTGAIPGTQPDNVSNSVIGDIPTLARRAMAAQNTSAPHVPTIGSPEGTDAAQLSQTFLADRARSDLRRLSEYISRALMQSRATGRPLTPQQQAIYQSLQLNAPSILMHSFLDVSSGS